MHAVHSVVLGVMLALCASPVALSADNVVRDDRGKAMKLSAPARRIVALAPSTVELTYAAGAGERLVGVARFSDYPPAARDLPQIGDATRIDLERVLSLKPDLIIGWKSGNQTADIERLEQLAFPVFVVEPATLAAIPRLLRVLGRLAGSEVAADSTADRFERAIAELRERHGTRTKVRVFYEIWHEPLMTVNGRHMINDVIQLCGGSNVFAGVHSLTPIVSLESIIAAQPEVVLGGSSAMTPGEFAAQWRRYESFFRQRGVKALFVNPDWIQRQTPRILEGARTVCEHLDRIRGRRE